MKTQNKRTQVTIFKYRTALFLACQARSENLNDSHDLWTRVIKEAEEIVSTMPIEVIEAVDGAWKKRQTELASDKQKTFIIIMWSRRII